MYSKKDLFMAGLIEGDGHIGTSQFFQKSGTLSCYPRVSLQMTDNGTVEKFASWARLKFPAKTYREGSIVVRTVKKKEPIKHW